MDSLPPAGPGHERFAGISAAGRDIGVSSAGSYTAPAPIARSRHGVLRRIPPAVRIFAYLVAGLTLGTILPRNSVVLGLAQSGTWFPKTVVIFAPAIIFVLKSAPLAKTLLTHSRAGRFLLTIVGLYVAMAAVSLVYVSFWIPPLTGLPLSLPGQRLPGFIDWLQRIVTVLGTVLTEQPLLQVLVAGSIAGALAGTIPSLHAVAQALIRGADWILGGFAKFLWYYPVMIGCLAIWIPSRFGRYGLEVY